MIRETKETKEIIVEHRYCDVCGEKLYWPMACSVATCEMCHKDLCDTCVGKEEYTGGDYREVYCSSCWNVGEPYRSEMQEHEDAIDKLAEEWRNKCKC